MRAGAPSQLSSYHASDGAAYERFLGRWTKRLAVPFIEFARLAPEGEVLDVGCAVGSLALALAETRPAGVVAVDIAEPYVAYARAREGAERIRFEVGDAAHLRYGDARFAAALAQLVLNFVADPLAAAREMRRVTRKGGVVAASAWDFRGGLVFQRLFWDTAAGNDPAAGAARDRLFSHPLALPQGLSELWQKAGLAHVERGSLTIRMDYASFEDYWEPLLGGQGPVGSYVLALSPKRRAEIEERVRAAYLAGADDGPRSLSASAWCVRGIVP